MNSVEYRRPGWICIDETSGRNSQLPTDGRSATKSTVMMRLSSGASTESRRSASAFWLPKPVRSHNTSYSGTSAKPNAKLPSAKPRSFSVSCRLMLDLASSATNSAPAHRHEDESQVERQRDEAEQPRAAANP